MGKVSRRPSQRNQQNQHLDRCPEMWTVVHTLSTRKSQGCSSTDPQPAPVRMTCMGFLDPRLERERRLVLALILATAMNNRQLVDPRWMAEAIECLLADALDIDVAA